MVDLIEKEDTTIPKVKPADLAAMQELSRLIINFNQASATAAPDRSLYTPHSDHISKDMFQRHKTVFIGEMHDDVNYKFLADNPAFFKEAAKHGARYMFLEHAADESPLFKKYFQGKITDKAFEDDLARRPGGYTSGDTPQAYAKAITAACRTAKENGIEILPSNFRLVDVSANVSSEAYGIPDIQGRNDSVRRQTLLSLNKFRSLYDADYPVTVDEQAKFEKLHQDRIEALPKKEREQFNKDYAARIEERNPDKDPDQVRYQDQTQFTYYSRMVKPGETSLFFGGRAHFTDIDGIDNLIRQNGYGSVGGIYLKPNIALMQEKILEDFAKATKDTQLAGMVQDGILKVKRENEFVEPFDYTIETERGIAYDRDQKIIPVPEIEKPKPVSGLGVTSQPNLTAPVLGS